MQHEGLHLLEALSFLSEECDNAISTAAPTS